MTEKGALMVEEKRNNRSRKILDYMTLKEYILYKFNIRLH